MVARYEPVKTPLCATLLEVWALLIHYIILPFDKTFKSLKASQLTSSSLSIGVPHTAFYTVTECFYFVDQQLCLNVHIHMILWWKGRKEDKCSVHYLFEYMWQVTRVIERESKSCFFSTALRLHETAANVTSSALTPTNGIHSPIGALPNVTATTLQRSLCSRKQ